MPSRSLLLASRFILENWVLDRWVRNILTVYPVVIVALVGNVWKHFHPDEPTANAVFTGQRHARPVTLSTNTSFSLRETLCVSVSGHQSENTLHNN